MKKCFQVLFNRPLQYEDEVLYGVCVPYDKDKAKHLMEYAVEWLIAQWCFTQKHGGKIEDKTKWIDRDGNIYSSWASRQLYAYTAALATQTYFRIDEWWVDDECDLDNDVEITDQNEYFNTRCLLEEQDYKTGYNGFLQVYQKLVARYHTLTQISSAHTDMDKLDYDDQEDAVWMSKILIDEECIVDNEGYLDELSF
jgi:hypothetical protein